MQQLVGMLWKGDTKVHFEIMKDGKEIEFWPPDFAEFYSGQITTKWARWERAHNLLSTTVLAYLEVPSINWDLYWIIFESVIAETGIIRMFLSIKLCCN